MSIVVNSLTYIHADGEVLFDNINFSISAGDKVSLVGNNGVGKSTLLRIVAGCVSQTKGEIVYAENPYYIPQHFGQFDSQSVFEVLKIEQKIKALHAILEGDASESNLDILDDDWDIEERVNIALKYWKIDRVDLSKQMSSLSGGEKTKVFLAGISIHSPSIILLDEPSNHLDFEGRTVLYDFIEKSKKTILIVSHDRELLNIVNKTIELTPDSVEVYGGNYNFYFPQKQLKMDALYTQLADREKNLKQVQQKSREIIQQRQKQESRGKVQKSKAGMPRILMGGLKNKAELSSAKMNSDQTEKVNDISLEISSLKKDIQAEQPLKISIISSKHHKGKLFVNAEDVNVAYDDYLIWENPKSFHIYSGDRVQIKGNNGAGKTSLIRLITQDKQPSTGNLFIADFTYLYVDQEYSIIRDNLTVFEQAQQFNDRCMAEHDLKKLLFHHQFTSAYWDRQCSLLSGGERMKLLLCCLSISSDVPDMLIFDEPTNNLDIYSQDILTHAINEFEGTVLVISHDIHFTNEIKIDRIIALQ